MIKIRLRDKVRLNVRYYRISKGITQDEMSELIGLTEKHYSHLEIGTYDITYDNLEAICRILDIEPWILFKEDHTEDEIPDRVPKKKKN